MKTLDNPSERQCDTNSTPAVGDLRKRALKLLRTEIGFIPNREFSSADLDNEADIGITTSVTSASSNAQRPPAGLPPHLARLVEGKLLTAEEERALFRRMNFLKFRANQHRSRINPQKPDAGLIKTIEGLLDEARVIRDRLIQSNLRLVMSIAGKQVTSQMSFDDLLSEGITTLMYAVEKFDYDRGFRFSTYAYRAISRHLLYAVKRRRKQVTELGHNDMHLNDALPDGSRSEVADRQEQHHRELLTEFVDRLDRRERFIIRARHALGGHRKKRTFRELAVKLGVSKERVRQLEKRALDKLREMADASAANPEQ